MKFPQWFRRREPIESSSSDKSAAVYKHGRDYFVHAQSRTSAGFWIASMPATLVPVDSRVEDLGAAVVDALAGGAVDVPTPSSDEFRAMVAPVLAIAKVRSWSALQRSAALCNVWRTARGVVVEPTRNGGNSGDDKGYHPLSDRSIVIAADCSPAELGTAIAAAFERVC